jgi:hypothetical protein
MRNRSIILMGLLMWIALALSMPGSPRSRDFEANRSGKESILSNRVLVLDGSCVHNVGELQMHMSNWGIFGSMPSSSLPFSFAPSAQWPARSGIEYLYVAGLWIGARVGGIPSVSTSAYEMEFRPTNDPIDVIYRTYEGAQGGNRYPFFGADDDRDGLIDEDRLDGRDNDGDGRIDEDYAAISRQMFTSWYTDDYPTIRQVYPEHRPLHVKIEQESYQWDDPRFDDFVGVALKITNIGSDVLEEVYLGMLADFDVGPRTTPDYWTDDGTNAFFGTGCTELGPASLNVMYGYDVDGDGGRTPGYFGCMLLGHTVDPLRRSAPAEVAAVTYRTFRGNQPYENGGDPDNDFQRYEVMASRQIDRNSVVPGDYRSLMCTGPFARLMPGQSIELDIGFVAGTGRTGMLDNAARAQSLYNGTWYDLDGDPMTGIDGKEAQIHWTLGRMLEIRAAMDIRPGSCPNPFNLNRADFAGGRNPKKGGVLPVAILGSGSFNVRDVDVASVRLEGVAPLDKKPHYKDVSRPVADPSPCACTSEGPDGYLDLALKFGYREIAMALDESAAPGRGRTRTLVLTGILRDGTPFSAQDCVVFVGKRDDGPDNRPDGKPDNESDDPGRKPELRAAAPNPFNPVTRVPYFLPAQQRVRVSVYDVSGRMVAVLVDGIQAAGEHAAEWQASGFASGIYFCRLEAGGYTLTEKIVLIR